MKKVIAMDGEMLSPMPEIFAEEINLLFRSIKRSKRCNKGYLIEVLSLTFTIGCTDSIELPSIEAIGTAEALALPQTFKEDLT